MRNSWRRLQGEVRRNNSHILVHKRTKDAFLRKGNEAKMVPSRLMAQLSDEKTESKDMTAHNGQ